MVTMQEAITGWEGRHSALRPPRVRGRGHWSGAARTHFINRVAAVGSKEKPRKVALFIAGPLGS